LRGHFRVVLVLILTLENRGEVEDEPEEDFTLPAFPQGTRAFPICAKTNAAGQAMK
jgi:hypothetical protein